MRAEPRSAAPPTQPDPDHAAGWLTAVTMPRSAGARQALKYCKATQTRCMRPSCAFGPRVRRAEAGGAITAANERDWQPSARAPRAVQRNPPDAPIECDREPPSDGRIAGPALVVACLDLDRNHRRATWGVRREQYTKGCARGPAFTRAVILAPPLAKPADPLRQMIVLEGAAGPCPRLTGRPRPRCGSGAIPGPRRAPR